MCHPYADNKLLSSVNDCSFILSPEASSVEFSSFVPFMLLFIIQDHLHIHIILELAYLFLFLKAFLEL